LHGAQSPLNLGEWFLGGQTQPWFSLEIISQEGKMHFLIRTLANLRDLVEAQIYAQYPETEIKEVGDYVYSIPDNVPNKDYNMWGTELIPVNNEAYPIRTYRYFSQDITLEEQRVDPLSSLLETMSKVKPGEQVWVQILIRPLLDEWKKPGEDLINKMLNRKTPKKGAGPISKEMSAWKKTTEEAAYQLATGNLLESKDDETKQSPDENLLLWMTRGEADRVKAIEDKLSKIGFETIIRFIYLGKTDVFSVVPNVPMFFGCIKQYNIQDLNGFKPNGKTGTKISYGIQGKKIREAYRKKRLLADYKKRSFVQYSNHISYLKPLVFERLPIFNWFFIRSKPFILNIEELASLYHFPSMVVKAPLSPKVEAKKSEPPVGLPTE
jgi:hypothetical protein